MRGQDDKPAGLSRRGLFLGAAALGGTFATAGQAAETGKVAPDAMPDPDQRRYAFYGTGPQAGIATPPQQHLMAMAFDLTGTDPRALQVLLARWSASIGLMMEGQPVGPAEPDRETATALETGEALGLGPAGLTVTVGLGPRVFSKEMGLAAKAPPHLRPLADLPSDALRPEISGGDLSLQACADDPQVAYHAVRILARIAKRTGAATVRWTQLGFGRASAGAGQETPRNLFGYRDGTRNITTPEQLAQHVWANDGPDWQHGGTYQVMRRIEMHIENWDNAQVSHQNDVFGRHKLTGAPLTGENEFDTPDFKAKNAQGEPVIPTHAHIRLSAHETNDGIRILRRGYNFTGGLNAVGRLDAGLFFISYQNDPAHFEALQRRLGASDLLNEYISHTGSGLFWVPPAAPKGSYIGAPLFAAV
ncbi:Dyp-type peroxidase [Thioclava sp. UBA3469]|uniref:Dyp-type peroxidase n=1 Tax=Thioclava sp. UBA3469 TaxID=1947693 RepID=UPI000C3E6F83|nr:Dyp-type peroxidase [Thioclava sp. UBA3469]MAQ36642.1 deferrochelatase/peroxidase EfeB [Thioclava sp.]